VAHGVRRESRISLQSGRDQLHAPYGLTDRALAAGDLVEIAQRVWRVERSMAASRKDAERRFLLVLDEADALPV
jgi:hypothetical protein